MDITLLKHVGNMEQLAGIREVQLISGRGGGMRAAEIHNAAGVRYTVVPDRGMDLYDLSYKGINLSFLSKNGLVSSERFSPAKGEFCDQWSAGAMVTCGLDNVGGESGNSPTHGRFGYTPAVGFGTQTGWEGEEYVLRATGEVHQSRLFGRHLSVRRTVETTLYGKKIRIRDVITNHEAEDEPFMLLYHCNLGYPLLNEEARFVCSTGDVETLNGEAYNPFGMSVPVDGADEELYLYRMQSKRAFGALINDSLNLGVCISYDTEHLPHMLEWKRMKSHDYVLGIEPCNTCGLNREAAIREGKIAVLPAYSSVETGIEIRILDGQEEIERFIHRD